MGELVHGLMGGLENGWMSELVERLIEGLEDELVHG